MLHVICCTCSKVAHDVTLLNFLISWSALSLHQRCATHSCLNQMQSWFKDIKAIRSTENKCKSAVILNQDWNVTVWEGMPALPWPHWNHTVTFFWEMPYQYVAGPTWAQMHAWLSENICNNTTVSRQDDIHPRIHQKTPRPTVGTYRSSSPLLAGFGEGIPGTEKGHNAKVQKERDEMRTEERQSWAKRKGVVVV